MAVKKIITSGSPVLRIPSYRVPKVNDKVRALLRDMADTMYAQDGCGLAACQVGVPLRLVVVDTGKGLIQLVNPEIVVSKGAQIIKEGCLSVPGEQGLVKRPWRVAVKAQNQWGEERYLWAQGRLAQCLCHEIDHLDGVLFTDKLIKPL